MRIIYKNPDGTVVVIIPSEEVLQTVGLKAIAEKDVPQDLPYWFALDTDIPTDRATRHLWRADETIPPDGFGSVSSEFTDEQLLILHNGGLI